MRISVGSAKSDKYENLWPRDGAKVRMTEEGKKGKKVTEMVTWHAQKMLSIFQMVMMSILQDR